MQRETIVFWTEPVARFVWRPTFRFRHETSQLSSWLGLFLWWAYPKEILNNLLPRPVLDTVVETQSLRRLRLVFQTYSHTIVPIQSPIVNQFLPSSEPIELKMPTAMTSREITLSRIPSIIENERRTPNSSNSSQVFLGTMAKWLSFEMEVRENFRGETWPGHAIMWRADNHTDR